MTILTKPGSLTKGTPAALSISKSELAALGVVSGDAYFSDTANWAFVRIIYVSSVGNQRHSAKFDCSESTPASTFITSARARDIFNVESISIVDFDGGSLSVPASALDAAEFRLDYAPVPAALSWTKNVPATLADYGINGGLVSTASGDWTNNAYGAAITGNFTLTYKIQRTSAAAAQFMIGYDLDQTADGSSNPNSYRLYLQADAAAPYDTAWVNTLNVATVNGTENIFIITRVSGLITYSFYNGTTTTTGTIQSSNSATVYPFVLAYNNLTRLNEATKL